MSRAVGYDEFGSPSLRSLGVTPVAYGDGLIDRLRAAAQVGATSVGAADATTAVIATVVELMDTGDLVLVARAGY